MSKITPPPSLLIAPPNMPDPRFAKSVLLLTHHQQGGSSAICINRPTEHVVSDVLRELDLDFELHFPVYWGGPVNSGVVWMLHSSEWAMEDTVAINDHWSMTSDVGMFAHLADHDCPRYFRITVGMSTWGPGQLQMELDGTPPWNKSNSWLVTDNPGPEWLFEQDPETLWDQATELCGRQAVKSWF